MQVRCGFSVGCWKHAHIPHEAHDVRDACMLVHVGVDDYWWHAVKTRRGPLISAAGDNCTSSVWTASRSSTAGGLFPLGLHKRPTCARGRSRLLPEGCRVGIDGLDRPWRLSASGPQDNESLGTNTVWKGQRKGLIKLAWEMDLAKGYEEQ